jgi:hypothetical protein
MDFDLDAVDDLKIAVEEAFLAAMRRQVESPVEISFISSPSSLAIELKGKIAPGERDSSADDFGNFILEAVVDELTYGDSQTDFDLHLVKNL